jgi:Ca2+-binding EF-hand superfamily protein
MKKKLEYAFNTYDIDGSGFLDKDEVYIVITGMLDLLGTEMSNETIAAFADDCFQKLDQSNDQLISKGNLL